MPQNNQAVRDITSVYLSSINIESIGGPSFTILQKSWKNHDCVSITSTLVSPAMTEHLLLVSPATIADVLPILETQSGQGG